MKVVVSHTGYGCDTGCCGHVVYVDDERVGDFQFSHPWFDEGLKGEARDSAAREFAEEVVREVLGDEHVADLDWDDCLIVDD